MRGLIAAEFEANFTRQLESLRSELITKINEAIKEPNVFDLQKDNLTAVDLVHAMRDIRTKQLLTGKGAMKIYPPFRISLKHIFVLVPRSCHEYLSRGIFESGYYDVDPDGFNFGQVPVRVYCRMEGGSISS